MSYDGMNLLYSYFFCTLYNNIYGYTDFAEDKVRSAETVPLQTPRGKMTVESMASFNQAFEAPAVFINGGSSTSSSEPELQ